MNTNNLRRKPVKTLNANRKRKNMTVCAAAICKSPVGPGFMVVGAADRMLTSGDIEFQPPVPKILPLTSSIFVMGAGDTSLHTQITNQLLRTVRDRVAASPENWWNVSEVVDEYVARYNEIRLREAKRAILDRYGLTLETFIQKTKTMSPDLVEKISKGLLDYELFEDTEAIICGVGPNAIEIYTVRRNHVQCFTNVGFAAIGGGAGHASSQLMFARHSFNNTLAETLLLVYASKKRAEVAPGVGQDTDMFIIGPMLGQSANPVKPEIMTALEGAFQDTQNKIAAAGADANKMIGTFLDNLAKVSPQQGIPDKDANPTQPPPHEDSSPPKNPAP